MIFRFLQVEKTIHMKCRNAGDCPIIHIKFPGSPALPPHGMKVMSEARKMMTSSQLCHPPGAVTAFPGTDLTTKRCSRPVGNRIPNGRESCSQGLGILFPAGRECWKSKFEYPGIIPVSKVYIVCRKTHRSLDCGMYYPWFLIYSLTVFGLASPIEHTK